VRVVGGERASRAGIECAHRLDALEQGLVASGGLERQGKKSWQVLAQHAVARQHGVEMAARLQPLAG